MKPVVAFLVNGSPDSGVGIRAHEFSERLQEDFESTVAYRSEQKIRSIWTFWRLLADTRPAVCYVVDMGYSGVLAATIYRILGRGRVIVDTGDAISELARLTGRGTLKLWMTRLLERLSLRISDGIVVRSHFHQKWLAQRGFPSQVIPDGVDTTQFTPLPDNGMRQKLGLDGFTTIGVLGSIIWNQHSRTCYGWELVELIRILHDKPVRGIIVGDGSGIPQLKKRCVEYGIEDRIIFLGRIPYASLPPILNLMDICLSTQTNDLAGQVRTTGKLPLYLACGKFVLASDVGEASLVLPHEMRVPYQGSYDELYPQKLAERVCKLLGRLALLKSEAQQVSIAEKHFEYSILGRHLQESITLMLDRPV